MFSETRQALSDFLKESGKSQRQIAKETGLSSSVISQFLKGIYPGDNQEIAKTIEQYLAVGKERLNRILEPAFYPGLDNTRKTLLCCYHSHLDNAMSAITGDAGAGKTTALKHYTEHNTGVIFVTANACTTTATAVLGLICKQLGKQIPARRAALMDCLVETLMDTNRLIIIDEADHLSLDALQAVRNLYDVPHCGIVFSGNDKFHRQMLSQRRGYEFEQIRTRIDLWESVKNDYTVEEIQAIFPGLDQECTANLLKMANRESLRRARKFYDLTAKFAAQKGETVTAKHFRDIRKQIYGEVLV